jgi:hypothetical protein
MIDEELAQLHERTLKLLEDSVQLRMGIVTFGRLDSLT